MLSNVSSSLKSFAKPKISSFETPTPLLTLVINPSRSSAVFFISPLREVWTSFAISLTVSWRNLAYSILAFNLLFRASSSFILSWKVDGSMFGNNLRNTGSKNSMNGTIMKTATGTNLKMSAVVRVSCCRSLLDRPFPLASLTSSLTLILTSAQSNFVPSQ